MKNKYAGVTLDWYDDRGMTLKAKFPTAEALPDIIKEAGVRPKEQLNHDDFALVAIDEGNVMRKFACHDPGTTAMSVIYFMEHGDKLPEGAQKMAAANLVVACEQFDLAPPEAMVKAAGLTKKLVELGGKAEVALRKGRRRVRDATSVLRGDSTAVTHERLRELARGGLTKVKKSEVVDITGQSPAVMVKVARFGAARKLIENYGGALIPAAGGAVVGAGTGAAKAGEGNRLKGALIGGGAGAAAGLAGGLVGRGLGTATMSNAGEAIGMGLGTVAGGAAGGLAGGNLASKFSKTPSASPKTVTAGVVDITGQSPAPIIKTAMPTDDSDYAVILPDGKRHYPIDSWDRIENFLHPTRRSVNDDLCFGFLRSGPMRTL